MEELMQYVWNYRLWPDADMYTVDGQRIRVLDTGQHNHDSGPDFFNARVNIGDELWVGNVEMHLRASDWFRHGHDKDRAYDSVILHVVDKDDAEVFRTDGQKIPQMSMKCDPNFSTKYHQLVNNPFRELACADEINGVKNIYISDWITALAHERLFTKTDRIRDWLKHFQGNWQETIYVTIARALGFSTNSEPFQLLAFSTPLKAMLRYTDSLLAIEALLFGQAGLLPSEPPADNAYLQQLVQEYKFLATKHSLKPSSNILWKMARMRPMNFPHRRIAALAMMIYKGFNIAHSILRIENEEEARKLFELELTGYWARHYNFSSETSYSVKAFSQSTITVLLINVIVPVIYAYGDAINNDKKMELAIDLLQTLNPESNRIIELFRQAGLTINNAFTTQALIHLRKEYCTPRRCLYCRIGHRLLSQKVKLQS